MDVSTCNEYMFKECMLLYTLNLSIIFLSKNVEALLKVKIFLCKLSLEKNTQVKKKNTPHFIKKK